MRAPASILLSLALLGGPAAQARPALTRAGQGRINLDVVGAEARDVLRLLAEVGGVNLVLGDEVAGRVTLRLRRVPWRSALQVILRVRGLEAEWRGGILRVGSRERFARERALRLGERERCLREAPLRTWTLRPSYASAASLAQALRQTLTPRGSITVDERTGTLVVRDVRCD